MKREDLVYLCTIVGNLSGIPVRLYKEDQLCFCHSVVALPGDPILLEHTEISVPNEHIRFFVTPNFFYYGAVVSGSYRIVAGPSRQAAAQDQELKEFARQLIRQHKAIFNSFYGLL